MKTGSRQQYILIPEMRPDQDRLLLLGLIIIDVVWEACIDSCTQCQDSWRLQKKNSELARRTHIHTRCLMSPLP